MQRWWALLALVAVAAASDCFNTLLYATPHTVEMAVPRACVLWNESHRTVLAAQADWGAEGAVVLLARYGNEPAPRLERFAAATGARIDAVRLRTWPVNRVAVSACMTALDLWVAFADGGALGHWNVADGTAQVSASPPGGAVEQVVCTADRLFARAPAARAVWELSPADGRAVGVPLRLGGIAAIAVGAGQLWAVVGTPPVLALTAGLDGSGWRAATAPPVAVASAAVRADGSLALLGADGFVRTAALVGATQAEFAYATHLDSLAGAAWALRAGVLVDAGTGEPVGAATGALANAGNVAALVRRPAAASTSTLVVVDVAGQVSELALAGPCGPLVLAARHAPVAPGTQVLDVAPGGALAYVAGGRAWMRASASAFDWASALSTDELVQLRASDGPARMVAAYVNGTVAATAPDGSVAWTTALPTTLVAPVVHWLNATAGVVFSIDDDRVQLWRIDGGGVAPLCTVALHVGDETWSEAAWSVAALGGGNFLVRWNGDVAFVLRATATSCTWGLSLSGALRTDASPLLAYLDGVEGGAFCTVGNGTRRIALPRAQAGAWIGVGVVMLVGCGTAMCVALVCAARATHATRLLRRVGAHGNQWHRLEAKRHWLACDHQLRARVHTFLACVAPCLADRVYALLVRHATAAPDVPGQAAPSVAERIEELDELDFDPRKRYAEAAAYSDVPLGGEDDDL